MGHSAGRRGSSTGVGLEMKYLAGGLVSFKDELEVLLLVLESCKVLL